MADTANQLTAIAPAGAPADTSRLKQHHRQTALRQLNRGIDASEAATDYADISKQITIQRRVGRARPRRSGVIRAGVLCAVLIHLFDFTLLHDRVIRRMIAWGGVEEM